MDSSSIDSTTRPQSDVPDCRVFGSIGLPLPRSSQSETYGTSESSFPYAGNLVADCRTVLLSENALFRAGLKQILQKSHIAVIGAGHDLHRLLDEMQMQPVPELVICHIAAERSDKAALDLIDSLRQHFARAKVVVLADTCTRSLLSSFISADVNAILLTSISGRMLLRSLESVLLDHRLFPAEILSLLADQPVVESSVGPAPAESSSVLSAATTAGHRHQMQAVPPNEPAVCPRLAARISKRERQIMDCLVKGLSNKCIARELNIVEATVKVHLKLLSRKLKMSNRTQLAIWALRHPTQFCTDNVVEPTEMQDAQAEHGDQLVFPASVFNAETEQSAHL